MDQLRTVMPLSSSSSAYWICKARVTAKVADDDFTAALAVLDEAEKHHPQVVILIVSIKCMT